jgi:hypothetical protein
MQMEDDVKREVLDTADISESTKTEADRLLLLVKRYCSQEIKKLVEESSKIVVKQKTMKTSMEEGYYKGYYDALKNVHSVVTGIEKGFIQ